MPFSVFIIVPAGELFLPVALKFFPNLLPSTYEDQKQKDSKANKLRSTRKDVSQFLRTTMKEGGLLPIGPKTRQCEEFGRFFRKVSEVARCRRSGGVALTPGLGSQQWRGPDQGGAH